MATQSDESKPTIVLVHGAWADATGFDAEIRTLQRAPGARRKLRVVWAPRPVRALGYRVPNIRAR